MMVELAQTEISLNVSRNRNAKTVTAAIGNAPSRNLIFFNSS